jgi:hypothetical protein
LPSLLSALVAHDCANAAPVEKDITTVRGQDVS